MMAAVPDLSVIVPVHVRSSVWPVIAAPGRHPATLCGSVRNFHTASGPASTTNRFSICIRQAAR